MFFSLACRFLPTANTVSANAEARQAARWPGLNTGRYQELAAGEPDHVAALKRDRRCQNGQLRFENGLAVPCREDAAGCGCGQRSGTKTRKWQYEPSETWSGRGKQPRWLIAALKTGHTIDEFVNRNVESNKNNFRRQRA